MLTCPPSRINITSADLANFDRRWAARHSAQREKEDVRLSQGAAKQTRLAFVPAAGRNRAQSCCSQATVCSTEDEDSTVHSNTASPPSTRLDLLSLDDKSNGSRLKTPKQDVSPRKKAQDRRTSGPTQMPTRPSPALDFPIYEDPPLLHAFVEARHFQQYCQHHGAVRALSRIRTATPGLQQSNVPAAPPETNQPQIPTLLYPPLDPGAPVFVPRTRFGSTTSIPDFDGGVVAETSARPAQRHQSTANLRIRSSFERNTQHSSRSTERHSVISDSSLSLVQTDEPQARRRSRTNDQNTALQRPPLGFDRYPAVRPQAVTFATRRNSGSQRPVVFPHRGSSRQHLADFERSRRTSHEHRRPSRPTHLTIPGSHGLRPVSPVVSTSSRSTPNLLHPPSASHRLSRSSSFSSDRDSTHGVRRVPPRTVRKAETTVSESSGLLDEILLQRDSPLDRIVQKYGRHATRPRSVGRSFERPPERRPRLSLLSGDVFRQDPADDVEDCLYESDKKDNAPQASLKQVQRSTAVERAIANSSKALESATQTPHKRQPTIEDPVALALALPSPEVPSSPMPRSSPVMRSSPLGPSTPVLRSGPSSPLLSPPGLSLAAHSPRSVASLASSTQSLAAAVTPRVPVYNDSHPTTHQPQTPADLARSSRRARGRSHTTSITHHSPLPVVQPSPTLGPPERHPHRHTFPSSGPQQMPEVTVSITPVREVTSALRHDSVMSRLQQRSSNSSENDIEGSLDGLEHDRRVWMWRREDGTLDVTPPREGRFERYLS